jgi:hypothetical protein
MMNRTMKASEMPFWSLPSSAIRRKRSSSDCGRTVCHYMNQPLVELYEGCMVVLKVS